MTDSIFNGIGPAIKYIKRDMKDSLAHKLDVTKEHMELKDIYIGESKFPIIFIGMYNLEKQNFQWMAGKDLILEHICQYPIGLRLRLKILLLTEMNKFKPHNVLKIMTILAIFNPAFKLVRFVTPNDEYHLYAFVQFQTPSCLPQKIYDKVMDFIDQ